MNLNTILEASSLNNSCPKLCAMHGPYIYIPDNPLEKSWTNNTSNSIIKQLCTLASQQMATSNLEPTNSYDFLGQDYSGPRTATLPVGIMHFIKENIPPSPSPNIHPTNMLSPRRPPPQFQQLRSTHRSTHPLSILDRRHNPRFIPGQKQPHPHMILHLTQGVYSFHKSTLTAHVKPKMMKLAKCHTRPAHLPSMHTPPPPPNEHTLPPQSRWHLPQLIKAITPTHNNTIHLASNQIPHHLHSLTSTLQF